MNRKGGKAKKRGRRGRQKGGGGRSGRRQLEASEGFVISHLLVPMPKGKVDGEDEAGRGVCRKGQMRKETEGV